QAADGDDKCFQFVSDFYRAVQAVFKKEWDGLSPKTSRLVHRGGIISMGRGMEVALHGCQAKGFGDFCDGLAGIRDQTQWTQGKWIIGSSDNVRERAWNEFQRTHPDIQMLSDHLDRLVRQSYRKQQEKLDAESTRIAVAG